MLKPIVRLWRRKGHGVHSPFAFGYIATVIAPRRDACYYAEPRLPDPHARLIYRAGVEAGGRIAVVGEGEEIPTAALDNGSLLTIIASGSEAMRRLAALAASRPRGVLFRGRRCAIFCARDIPHLAIDVAIP